MIHTDSFYIIGQTHKTCQDYVYHSPGRVLLSDGCSSAGHSEIGSKILVHSAKQRRSLLNSIKNAETVCDLLSLPIDSLCATLMEINFDDYNKVVTVNMVGDGCIVARKRDTKELEFHNVMFLSGAPFYLRYTLDDYKQIYINEFGDLIIENDEVAKSFFETYPEGLITKIYSTGEYDLVAVFSDGISSFTDKAGNVVPYKDVAKEVLAFKGTAGAFVERRARRALENYKNQGISHYDDFSMGVIYVEI